MNIKNIIIKLIGYLHYPENYLVNLGLNCGNKNNNYVKYKRKGNAKVPVTQNSAPAHCPPAAQK